MLLVSKIKADLPWGGEVLYIKVTGQDNKHIREINQQVIAEGV